MFVSNATRLLTIVLSFLSDPHFQSKRSSMKLALISQYSKPLSAQRWAMFSKEPVRTLSVYITRYPSF